MSRLILNFYKKPLPELPTLVEIYAEVKKSTDEFDNVEKEVLKTWFCCKRRNKKMQVYQRSDAVAHRHFYLMKIREYREKGFEIFNQDET